MTVSWVPSVDASTFGQLGRKKGGRDRLSVGAFPLSWKGTQRFEFKNSGYIFLRSAGCLGVSSMAFDHTVISASC